MINYKGKIRKRVLAVLICFSMMASMILPVKKAEAGVLGGGGEFLGDFFTEMLLETAVETIERGIVFGLEEASSDDTELLDMLISFMHSAEENRLEELLELCEEILEKAEVIDAKVDKIVAQNQEIIKKIDKQSLDKYNDDLVAFNDKYKNIYEQYMNVIEAAKAYAQDPESSSKKQAMMTAYSDLESFYNKCESGQIDLTGDVQKYAQTISPYAASAKLLTKEEWAASGTSKSTYMSTYLECVKDVSATQEQIRDDMEYALNSAAAPFYYYQTCVGIYNAMKLQEVNSDSKLSASDRATKLDAAWKNRSDLTNYGINAINQASDYCYDILTGYRWKADEVPTAVDFDYNTSSPSDDFAGSPVKTGEQIELSFMTAFDGRTYGIRSDGGINPSMRMSDLATKITAQPNYKLSQDYSNIRLSKVTTEAAPPTVHMYNDFILVSSPEDLLSFTQQASYNSVSGNMYEYLRVTGQNEYIFNDVTNVWCGVTAAYQGANISHLARIYTYDIKNLTSEHMDAHYIDAEDLYENSDYEGVFIYKEDEKESHQPLVRNIEIKDNGYGTEKLYKKGEAEAQSPAEDGKYKATPGEPYTLKLKPEDGYKAVKAVIYRFNAAGEKEEIRSYDLSGMKNVQKPDDDGFYTVTTYASHYRDVQWEITYEEETVVNHMVTLDQPADINQGSIQFAAAPGIDKMTYETGDEVIVYVRGETPYISDGITVKTDDNEQLAVREADASQMALASGSNTVGYVFTMPDSDVYVSTALVKGQTVTISSSDNGSTEFTDEYGNVLSKGNKIKTGISGSSVYMKAFPDNGYHLNNVTVQRTDNSENVAYTEKNGVIEVIVPDDAGLIAKAMFNSSSGVARTVEIKTAGSGTAEFELQGTTGLSTHDYIPGRTVNVLVKPDEGGGIGSVAVTEKGKTDAKVPGVTMETYKDNDAYRMVSFVMPSYDVDIDIDFEHVAKTTLTVDDEAMADIYMKSADGGYEYAAGSAINGTKDIVLKAGEYRMKIEPSESDAAVYIARNGGEAASINCSKENGELICDFNIENEDKKVDINVKADTEVHYIADYDEWCKYRDLMNGENGAKWQGDTYILLGDIDCGGNQIGQINTFKGTIDGKGHTIKNQPAPDSNSQNGGIIDYLNGGSVKNLTFDNFNVDGGRDFAGIIANRAVSGKTSGDGDSNIDNCKVSGTCLVGSTGTSGGLIGRIEQGASGDEFRIYNCEVYCRVSGYAKYATTGGIVGSVAGGNTKVHIYNSHFSGILDAGAGNWVCKYVGGVVGFTEGAYTWIDNCHMDSDLSALKYKQMTDNNAWVSRVLNGNGTNVVVKISDTYALGAVMSGSSSYAVPLTFGGYSSSSEVDDKGDISRDSFKSGDITAALNTRATSQPQSGFSQQWKQDADRPVLADANIDPVAMYSATVASDESGTAGFEPVTETSQAVTTIKSPAGRGIKCYIKSTEKNSTAPMVTVYEGDAIYTTNRAVYNEENGCYEAEFIMPAADVRVEYEFENNEYAITAKVTPTEDGNAEIVDAAGNRLEKVGFYDTAYLKLTALEGKEPGGIYLYSGSTNSFYSSVSGDDLVKNENGLYPFKINGGSGPESGKLITVNVNMTTGLYDITEDASASEGLGTVSIGVNGEKLKQAHMGETVKVSAKPDSGNFCSGIEVLETETGNKIKDLWLETDGSGASIGEFKMPGHDVTVKVIFSSRLYNIEVDKGDNVELNVRNGQGNDVTMARTGEKVTVSWDLDKAMFKTLKVERKNAKLFTNKLVKELDTSGEQDTFTMPADDVVIVAQTDDKDYRLIRDTEGSGYVMLNDLTTHDKEKGKAGQTIFAALYPAEGWKLKAGSQVIDEKGNVLATLDEAKKFAVFTMPQSDITITGGFVAVADLDTDENGTYLISDFKELQDVAKAIQEDPETYAKANYRLTNPIHGDGGEWTVPIGTAEHPFEGTFDGAGYYLMDYKIDTDADDMAIFGVIGENGTVKNMGAVYGRITSSGSRVAELAAVNHGVIDGCYSGSNLTGGTVTTKNGVISLDELNTVITNENGGSAGLVCENYGVVINSRSHSNVTGKSAAGVALYNYGVIKNAYNYGNVTGLETAGGIAGVNAAGASIVNTYDSGKVTGGTKAGAIAAINEGDIAADKSYYGIGQAGAQTVLDAGTAMALSDMRTNGFKDMLNENIEKIGETGYEDAKGMNKWIRDSGKNGGYPRISSQMIVSQTLSSSATKVSITGEMHAESFLKASALQKDSEAYRAFAEYANGNMVVRAVDTELLYRNGDAAEYEGRLVLSLDGFKGLMKGVKLVKYEDGKVSEVKFERVGSNYVINVDRLVPVALIATPDSVYPGDLQPGGSDTTTADAVKTGDPVDTNLILLLMMASATIAAAALVTRRRKA